MSKPASAQASRPPTHSTREYIDTFLESILRDVDDRILLVDRNLETGELIVISETGEQLIITVRPMA